MHTAYHHSRRRLHTSVTIGIGRRRTSVSQRQICKVYQHVAASRQLTKSKIPYRNMLCFKIYDKYKKQMIHDNLINSIEFWPASSVHLLNVITPNTKPANNSVPPHVLH